VPYGLAASLYTCDVSVAFKAMEQITTGVVYIDAGTIGAEWNSVYIDYSGRLQKAQIDR